MGLDYSLRSRVKFLIDNDTNCISSKIGIRVISPGQVLDYPIDTVIISSFEFRQNMLGEFLDKNIKIIDIYEILEKKSIILNRPFYEMEYAKEDFN